MKAGWHPAEYEEGKAGFNPAELPRKKEPDSIRRKWTREGMEKSRIQSGGTTKKKRARFNPAEHEERKSRIIRRKRLER